MAPRKPKALRSAKKANKEAKVTLGDTAGMKYALDSAVIECLMENGYEVDNTYSNLRLVVGFIAISLAAIAQFYPGKLEENWFLILFCVVTYIVISGFLALFVYFIEKDAIMITKQGKKNGPPMRISSTMAKYSEYYCLTIEFQHSANASEKKPVSNSNSVGKYFYADGVLADTVIASDILKLLHTFQEKD